MENHEAIKEYTRLLKIAEASDHPMDKAMVGVLKKQIKTMGGQFCSYCGSVILGYPCPSCGGEEEEPSPVYALMRSRLDAERGIR